MRLGAIVRGEDRGLGVQSWEFCRAMRPERTLLVDMGELARGFPVHRDRYPGTTVVRYEGGELPEQAVREWLDGLDVVFAVETMYDWRLPGWAAEAGVATVVQANPEFFRDPAELASVPTRWWAPTPWRLPFMPEGTRVVPVPVADDRFAFRAPERAADGVLRVLHVAGHAAMADRNGTGLVLEALRRLRPPVRIRIVTQDPRLRPGRVRSGVDLEVIAGGVADYWRLYDDADVLLMPRRYGGLCLPAQEAMAAGLGVVMSDCEPQRSIWPAELVRSATGAPRLRCPGGRLALTNARPEAIAETLNALGDNPERVAALQAASLAWAEANRWSALRPLYEAELASACLALAR